MVFHNREPLPRVNLSGIARRAARLFQDPDIFGFIGVRLSGRVFDEFAQAMHAGLTATAREPHVIQHVRQSLLYLVSQILTDTELRSLTWRFAANASRLYFGPIGPWTHQGKMEWVPMQIQRVARGYNRRGQPGANLDFTVLAGSPVGTTIKKFWSRRFCQAMASRMGFSRPWKARPFRDVAELFHLQLFGRINPELCHDTPDFDNIDVSSTQAKHNHEILRRRTRIGVNAFVCPYNVSLSVRCHHCPIGYEQCKAATHSKTYTQTFCEACHSRRAYFDPLDPPRDLCIDCYQEQQARTYYGGKQGTDATAPGKQV